MPLHVWIAEDYEFTHERIAAASMVERLENAFGKDETPYHLLCNILMANGSADALLIKPDGFIIIELKSFDCPVSGSENGPWLATAKKNIKTQVKGGCHANPFQQVRKYRFDLMNMLQAKRKEFLNLQRDRFDFGKAISAIVLFDTPLEKGQDSIDLAGHHVWFRHGRMDNFAGLVASITSPGSVLTPKEIDILIEKVFRVTPAKLIDGVPVRNTESVPIPQNGNEPGEREIEKIRKEVSEELAKLRDFMEEVQQGKQTDEPASSSREAKGSAITAPGLGEKEQERGRHIIEQYNMEFCTIDCQRDRIPNVFKDVATHELLVCVRSNITEADLEAIKALLEECLGRQTSAIQIDDRSYIYWHAGKWLREIEAIPVFNEIHAIHASKLSCEIKYNLLFELIDRVSKQLTVDASTRFSNLYSRLKYLCKQHAIENSHIDKFRINANKIMRGAISGESRYMEDLKSICEFVAQIFNSEMPRNLSVTIENVQYRAINPQKVTHEFRKEERLIVEKCDGDFIYGTLKSDNRYVRVGYGFDNAYLDLKDMLRQGDEVNLLYPYSASPLHEGEVVVLSTSAIVYDPDYLVSVTDLCNCIRDFGNDARHYLIKKFSPTEVKPPLVLGNLAGQLLADSITQKNSTFRASYKQFLHDSGLEIASMSELNGPNMVKWLGDAENQCKNIKEKICREFPEEYQIDLAQTRIESEFISSAMGLNGRMDCLYVDEKRNSAVTIELKSGKEAWKGGYQIQHFAQVALYRDILYCLKNIPREDVEALLFYSKTGNAYGDTPTSKQISEFVQLRNHMVFLDRQLCDGEAPMLFETLEASDIIPETHPLYRYIAPRVEEVLNPIKNADNISKEYFYRFLRFVMGEHFLSKTGDSRMGSTQGFSKTWNATLHEKLLSGDIVIDLRVERFEDETEVRKIIFAIPNDDEDIESSMNFRDGDTVIIYERNNIKDLATNQFIMRGSIETIGSKEIVVSLTYPQRPAVFNKSSLYAIEHSDINSARTPLLGLHSLLSANRERRELVLGLRMPETDDSESLNSDDSGKSDNHEIRDIVLQAKQAKDCYLLLGPPGSGKTSRALSSMVHEFSIGESQNILLMAYTNRAVDEICETLERGSLDYIRFGQELKCGHNCRKHLLKNMLDDSADVASILELVQSSRIVVGTISSLAGMQSLFNIKHFDVAIIDEAAQILEPYMLQLLCGKNSDDRNYIDKFILIGDHKQLPAVTQQSDHVASIPPESPLRRIGLKSCRNSLFERLYELYERKSPASVGILTHQARMHPVIGDFPNQLFYNRQLHPLGTEHQNRESFFEKFNLENEIERFIATNRVAFFPSSGSKPVGESHKVSKSEAKMVAKILQAIYQLYIDNEMPFSKEKSVGVIVPFRNQIAQIRKEIRSLVLPEEVVAITIDTVERYQGSERDIIIFSTTISQPYQKSILSIKGDDDDGDNDNIPIDRKLNVAVTRAREQLFVTGNMNLLRQIPIYEELIIWLCEKGGSFDVH